MYADAEENLGIRPTTLNLLLNLESVQLKHLQLMQNSLTRTPEHHYSTPQISPLSQSESCSESYH